MVHLYHTYCQYEISILSGLLAAVVVNSFNTTHVFITLLLFREFQTFVFTERNLIV